MLRGLAAGITFLIFCCLTAAADAQGWHREADCPASPDGFATRCGYISLPQDLASPQGSRVEIFYTVIESRSQQPKPDPLVYLVGGPGSSGTRLLQTSFRAYLRAFADQRDIIVIDQRGTGLSNPPLYCREALYRLDEILQSHHADHAGLMLEILSDCHRRLSAKDINFASFHSVSIARDIAYVMLALGYEEWNLVGVSYGTRLALVMMREYPELLRSVILDSVYPPQADIYVDAYYHGERALELLFAACRASASCDERYPDLETRFYELYADLNRQPAQARIRPPGYKTLDIEISGYRLYDWVFGWLYEVDTIRLIPHLINEIAQGRTSEAALQGVNVEAVMTALSMGMHYTVQCQEEYGSAADRDYAQLEASLPHLSGYLRYPVEGMASLDALCEIFAAKTRTPQSNTPVSSDVPALLLSGEYDPITPPAYADAAATSLSAAYNFRLPHIGHGVLRSHACAVEIGLAFIDQPHEAPPASCIAEIQPLDFR